MTTIPKSKSSFCLTYFSTATLFTAVMLIACACGQPSSVVPRSQSTDMQAAVTPTQENQPQPNTSENQPLRKEQGALATQGAAETVAPRPAIGERREALADALQSDPPILLLSQATLSEEAQLAQSLALQQAEFTRFVRQGPQALPLRNEIMGVRPVLPSDLDEMALATCASLRCYRVEMYNYAYNLTTVALVNIDAASNSAASTAALLDVMHLSETQPDIPDHLTELAVDIAINAPEVAAALGFQPSAHEAAMPNIKTALNDSRCERSQHLCVAPTFLQDDRALWAIVDLTDLRLVGVRWTELGTTSTPYAVTEESLQNEVVSELYCERSTPLARAGWSMDYMLTSSDGLRISNVQFGRQQVMRSAKLVDWHVSYSKSDGFGYSDAVGCPIFSSAAVIAYNGPYIEEIEEDGAVVGFALIQDFMGDGWPQPCHYRYEQRYEFYDDGRFRVGGANLGRGCGTDGVYRPVVRIDITASGDGTVDSFAEWSGDAWMEWTEEQWRLQTAETQYTDEGYQYRVLNESGAGFYIEPNVGLLDNGSHGDNAYVYVTKRHAERDEGEADLVTIGSCCNVDHQQGPEQFMQPVEPISGSDLVIWYVAQMQNDDTPGREYCWADAVIEDGLIANKSYPCAFGPMFVPIE